MNGPFYNESMRCAVGIATLIGIAVLSLAVCAATPLQRALEFVPADLPIRRALAEGGTSLTYEAPISEVYFTLLDARVEENAIVLDVVPVNDRPNRLFHMLLYRDAPFAGCG